MLVFRSEMGKLNLSLVAAYEATAGSLGYHLAFAVRRTLAFLAAIPTFITLLRIGDAPTLALGFLAGNSGLPLRRAAHNGVHSGTGRGSSRGRPDLLCAALSPSRPYPVRRRTGYVVRLPASRSLGRLGLPKRRQQF